MAHYFGFTLSNEHLYTRIPALSVIDSWDVQVYVAAADKEERRREEEEEPWGVIWELGVGSSERRLWSVSMFQSYADPADSHDNDVDAVLLVRVWFVGRMSEIVGKIGEEAMARIKASHLLGVQSKVTVRLPDLRPQHKHRPFGSQSIRLKGGLRTINTYEMGAEGSGILRFYNLTYATAASIVCGEAQPDSHGNIPFQFRRSALEQNMLLGQNHHGCQQDPLMLMGRSGTGKTTVCSSRIMNDFMRHWGKKNHRLSQMCSVDKPDLCSTGHGTPCYQLFVTRNHYLCEAVRRMFLGDLLSSGRIIVNEAHGVSTMRYPFPLPLTGTFPPTQQLPNDFTLPCSLPAECWPMFVSSAELWKIIDASLPGKRYLSEAAANELISGKLDDATVVTDLTDPIPPRLARKKPSEVLEAATMAGKMLMTFELFHRKYWGGTEKNSRGPLQLFARTIKGYGPHINAAMIWSNIKSFIKGSLEAVVKGEPLNHDEFVKDLGKKRAQLSEADRGIVHLVSEKYVVIYL